MALRRVKAVESQSETKISCHSLCGCGNVDAYLPGMVRKRRRPLDQRDKSRKGENGHIRPRAGNISFQVENRGGPRVGVEEFDLTNN